MTSKNSIVTRVSLDFNRQLYRIKNNLSYKEKQGPCQTHRKPVRILALVSNGGQSPFAPGKHTLGCSLTCTPLLPGSPFRRRPTVSRSNKKNTYHGSNKFYGNHVPGNTYGTFQASSISYLQHDLRLVC